MSVTVWAFQPEAAPKFPMGLRLASVEGDLRVGEAREDLTPDTLRTRPYSFEDLRRRWGNCSVDSVERIVGTRFFKVGHGRFVRPSTLLVIEREREGGAR